MVKKERVTLSFITYPDIAKLDSERRIKKVLDLVLGGRIVILQGKLEASEEAGLIQATMALVGRIRGFKGVELAVINPDSEEGAWEKVKLGIAKMFAGQRYAFTIIGPASIVKEVKRDPKKIEFLLSR